MSYVVATAGHVDHGKSTLVKRLTGMEPDRWEEERQRGLTIDLGFVWADIDGQDVAFVDVPGHERFIANMLAGVGPAPAVMLVVAADEGVMAQTVEHMAAIDGFGIRTGVIAVTRADRAEGERRQTTRAQIADAVARTTLQDWPVVEVSAVTGEGLDELRTALAEVLRAAPAPDAGARVRFWVDRSFTVKGAGTVVTGTLTAGTIRPGDTLALRGEEVQVRSVQSEDAPIDTATPARRVALNLRGVDAERVGRGDALTTPGAWHRTALVDVVLAVSPPEGGTCEELPREAVAHIGTAGVGCRVRSLGPAFARLTLEEPLPLTLGDTIVLRGTGGQRILAGLTAIDVDPEPFTRRGDAARRAEELDPDPDVSRRSRAASPLRRRTSRASASRWATPRRRGLSRLRATGSAPNRSCRGKSSSSPPWPSMNKRIRWVRGCRWGRAPKAWAPGCQAAPARGGRGETHGARRRD
ncbi:selenocysteine-specific translation elongation factor [Corynebacterium aquatimens]|uniref:selenocysteine-specific translation elongation factor n=1 Tax=Corynebacterium aquatimens TaxID=1190508 RepID=UPI003313C516